MVLRWRPLLKVPVAVDEDFSLPPLASPIELSGDRNLATEMIRSHRQALLLRPQVANDLTDEDRQNAKEILRASMVLVPFGRVRLDCWCIDAEGSSDIPKNNLHIVDAAFLDRTAVTNMQFQAFVDQGGYDRKTLWHASVWPRVKDFVDTTGAPGPRFWEHGRYAASSAEHPVVGVSWFEAEAYARWVGKRLPTDAEWVKAACCPIETQNGLLQRRYPWGDVFDRQAANLWGSGCQRTAAVGEYDAGDSALGVRQLIGNVWEWTASNVQLWWCGREAEVDEPLKSLRGGAFDTYFETQATCQLCSGDSPLARPHNVGFRCAVSACDLIDEVSE